METPPASFIADVLLPDGHERAVVPGAGVERGQRRAVEDIWALVLLQVGLEGGPRAFVGHGEAFWGRGVELGLRCSVIQVSTTCM